MLEGGEVGFVGYEIDFSSDVHICTCRTPRFVVETGVWVKATFRKLLQIAVVAV